MRASICGLRRGDWRWGGSVGNPGLELGLVQVYTGNGKGKTTAALGAALRACGHGLSVWMIQFMKGSDEYGEVRIAAEIPGFSLMQTGLPTFVDRSCPGTDDRRLAEKGWKKAWEILRAGNHDVIILDEINVAVDYGLVPLEDLVRFIEEKPRTTELILTGRSAKQEIMDRADLVSEVVEVKHHYQRGVAGRRGIEF
ncbi:MAG: cob(I)yrinic acid a,c-diamide adenosyltransferase [Candidatus Eisenbacteria sp.]|nr:cob(I)yrinic acid a,c-diamide adenosyltransferase [Candidatus Eisenbacteria bacterium]